MTEKQMTKEVATALRKPFPPESVGKLPKGGMLLDFVGHAAVTDRLLTVDPSWSWEPFSLDEHGLPAIDKAGNLWIRLTICGTTRIGVGDGKSAKEAIGDAIRNAAMRFGVALDLWAKENLVEFEQAVTSGRGKLDAALAKPAPKAQTSEKPPPPDDDAGPEPGITKDQLRTLQTLASKLDMSRETRLAGLSQIAGREITTANDLLFTEASAAIKSLADMVRASEAVADELPVA